MPVPAPLLGRELKRENLWPYVGSHYRSGFGVESIISEEPVSDFFFFKIKGIDESQLSS